ncbi:GAF and ANTAR domain-containing protein [Actinotalea sp. K2]|uniref:GAF and ANTAR domain-containing protein n=1 Tax=Actinotalea sp. K2 TaxID=2939438 RepID=UPI0020180085|nr:GAF and ANTAR domain-containing protein [Actinotalea sp. K2]MCL3862392.1 GAF and ANTAR domain-containing protein [Actinotalea sp. K2]
MADDERNHLASSRDAGTVLTPGDLAAELSRVALSLEQEEDLQGTLDAIVGAAIGTVPGAQHASISMVKDRREVITRASTSELPRRTDNAQYDAGEGPCLDVLYHRRTVQVPQMATEQRWPRFSATASRLGAGSMLCVRLFVNGDDLGALNLLSESPHAFSQDSEDVALLFATHAAVAIVGAAKEEQLRDALVRRDTIGQAMGIVMERYGLTPKRSFAVLARLSQHRNIKLHDLARQIVQTRLLPGDQ